MTQTLKLILIIAILAVFILLEYFTYHELWIKLGINWSISSLLNKVTILIVSLLLFTISYQAIKSKVKIFLVCLICLIPTLISFMINPIYLEDYNWKGKVEVLTPDDNLIIKKILDFDNQFDGVICLASTNCPYCKNYAQKFSALEGKLDILFILFTYNKNNEITEFKKSAKASSINCLAITLKEEKDFLKMCKGKFPTFFYFKKNKAIYKWNATSFGLPVFDWIQDFNLLSTSD